MSFCRKFWTEGISWNFPELIMKNQRFKKWKSLATVNLSPHYYWHEFQFHWNYAFEWAYK
jgi:hypothetical protein